MNIQPPSQAKNCPTPARLRAFIRAEHTRRDTVSRGPTAPFSPALLIARGTTTRGLVALMRAAGAREVHMRVASPPITGPCYYGIDIPTRKELIAANKTVPEIAQTIGVESLAYLSLDGMLNAVPGGPDGFCHACFSGQYPITPPRGADVNRAGRTD
jgi:glutamine phosphoribosylpyrophosphate amidotransferase